MKIILSFLLIIISVELHAQSSSKPTKSPFDITVSRKPILAVEFQHSDTIHVKTKYYDIIDSIFQIGKNYDFEFRFSRRYMFPNADNVFILRLDNGSWSARYFDRRDGTVEDLRFTERSVDQTKLRELCTQMVYNDVLTLPNDETLRQQRRLTQYEIDSNFYRVVGKSMITSDGVLYGFELSAPERRRDYQYGNPEAYHKFFPHVEELAKASLIIKFIDMYLLRTGIRSNSL